MLGLQGLEVRVWFSGGSKGAMKARGLEDASCRFQYVGLMSYAAPCSTSRFHPSEV